MPSVTVTRNRASGSTDSVVASVAAAVERLLEAGERFTTLGVQRIADESGIARSTFYRYFPDKSTLLIEVAGAATAEQLAVATAWLEEAGSRKGLDDAMRVLVARHRENATLVRALNEVAGYDEEVAAYWRRRIEESARSLAEFIEHGHAAGTVNPALAPQTTAELIAWGVERLVTQQVMNRPQASDGALAEHLSATIWSMLGLDIDWQAQDA